MHLALTEDVHVNVVDRLSTQLVAVHDHAETFFTAQLFGQTLGGEQDMSCQPLVLFGQVIEGADRLFRDDQKMHRCLWGDIVEGQNLVVLVDDLGRDFPVDDLGEQSFHYGCSM
ncbi:hypothetical protein D3C79_840480 [compost metagenome]